MELDIDISERKLFNYKFIPLLKNKKRYLFLKWWAWSWKSVFVAQKEIIKTYDTGNKLMVVRKVRDTHKDSTFAELKWIIVTWDLEKHFNITTSPLSIINKLTGSSIIFRWMDDPEKVKSVSNINRIWIEEATELTKNDFTQLDLRLRGKKNMQITCTFNPISADHWLNTDIWVKWSNENIELMHTTFLDNRFVWDEYKWVIEWLKEKNPSYYKIYWLWEWGILEGLVFEAQPRIIEEIPEWAEFLCYWLDFWFTNDPTVLIALYRRKGGILFHQIFHRTWLTNQDIVKLLKENNVDSNADIRADSSEPKSIEEIHRAGYNIKPVKKGKDSIMFWIDLMKQYDLYITRVSSEWISEFKNYVWSTDKNWNYVNKPVDFNNHCIDASRYWCMMSLWQKQKFFVV